MMQHAGGLATFNSAPNWGAMSTSMLIMPGLTVKSNLSQTYVK